jgi:serine protease AprX
VWQDVFKGTEGMNDVAGHSQQVAIETAVLERLMDGRSARSFAPDAMLNRQELAKALVMGASVRQHRSLDNEADISLSGVNARYRIFAESVAMPGAALKDAKQEFGSVMMVDNNGDFHGKSAVTRADLAYSLVQVIGKTQEALDLGEAHQITVNYHGESIVIADQSDIADNMRGYVQIALNEGLLGVRYSLKQGQFDLQPTMVARFNPEDGVTRASYAIIANQIDKNYFVSGTSSNAE